MAGRWSVGLAAVAMVLAFGASQAGAQGPRGDDARLVEVTAPSAGAAQRLGDNYDVGYVTGGRTAVVVATDDELARLRADGFTIGKTVADRQWIDAVRAEREATLRRQDRAERYAERGVPARGLRQSGQADVDQPGEVTIMRAYTFTNYAGKFLYVEAYSRLGTTGNDSANLSVATAGSDGVFGTAVPFTMPIANPPSSFDPPKYTDAGQYMYHRHLQPITGDPAKVRVASDKGGIDEAPITTWLGRTLPPHVPTFQTGFFDHYMDPTEVYTRFDQLEAQFGDIADIVNLPEKTAGYQRRAATIVGAATFPGGQPNTFYRGQTGNLQGANATQAVILESKAMGHEGGNLLTAQLVNPGTPSSPLSVSMNGMDLTVSLATDATGTLTSTAAQIVAAINADPAASALFRAFTYRGNAGAGVAVAGQRVQLSDYLNAPSYVQRGPFQMRMLRIGAHRDGSKVGVFIYCQQHAREWVTPVTCVETAERLLRNYATDPQTKELVDNLDIFIVPSINPDGGHVSLYDNQIQRKNLTNHCLPNTFQDPMARNAVGVDLNRNNSVGSAFDGFSGAGIIDPANPATFNQCTGETFAGPSELSEPEIRNEHWVVDTFSNIKFAINIHTHGGYFMWSPGAYKVPGRITLPAPNIGIERYFFDVADTILARIKESRNTVILPNRTGPIADVLYSAAGNSADDQYYRKGVIAYSFEAGAQRVTFNAQNQMVVNDVGFFPAFATEGKFEALEFADGNYGLLEGALEYAKDTSPPVVDIEYSAAKAPNPPIHWQFNWPGEAAVIHYTTDGSTPTLASPTYEAQGPRRPGQVFTIDRPGTHVVKWIAVDIKGNVSAVQSQTFLIGPDVDVSGTVPGTLALTLGAPVTLGAFTPGVAKDYTGTLTANVISTAGDAALSVTDSSTNATGRLVNGAFALPRALQLQASSPAGTGSAFAPLSSTPGAPLPLLTYAGPTSNDPVTIGVKQSIGSSDPLRTGTYSKTLTFTLSTTNP